jgi:hypothetical protein
MISVQKVRWAIQNFRGVDSHRARSDVLVIRNRVGSRIGNAV